MRSSTAKELKAIEAQRQRLAWTVLLAALVIFLVLVLTIPWGLRTWIITSTTAQEAVLKPITGTILVNARGVGTEMPEFAVREGDVIRTDQTSRASLTFFDGSEITIFPGTEIQLREMRSPSFDLSPHPNTVVIIQNGGRIRLIVAPPASRVTQWQVVTPHLLANFEQGSYSVEVTNEESEVAARNGVAQVVFPQSQEIPAGKRYIVTHDQGSGQLLDLARDLLVNGDFSQGMTGWEIRPPAVEGLPQGNVDLVTDDGRRAVRFLRQGPQEHTEAGIVQTINRDVSDFGSLQIRLDVLVDFHDLSGGGSQSSEYPVIVRIDYEDEFGSPNHWYHGFYIQNDTNNPILNGQLVPGGVWFAYEEPSLMEFPEPRPAFIRSIQVYASGWNYDSMVSEISLVVE